MVTMTRFLLIERLITTQNLKLLLSKQRFVLHLNVFHGTVSNSTIIHFLSVAMPGINMTGIFGNPICSSNFDSLSICVEVLRSVRLPLLLLSFSLIHAAAILASFSLPWTLHQLACSMDQGLLLCRKDARSPAVCIRNRLKRQ